MQLQAVAEGTTFLEINITTIYVHVDGCFAVDEYDPAFINACGHHAHTLCDIEATK